MNSLRTFEMQAGIFAVFWFLYSLYAVWKARKSYDERVAEAVKAIDDLISAVKLLPLPKILPGLFIGLWLFCTVVDMIGIALLFNVVDKVDWIVKILTLILIIATFNGLRRLIDNLQVMNDEQRFREKLLAYTNLRAMRLMDIEDVVRVILSLILVASIYF